jgi:hypothetical protein
VHPKPPDVRLYDRQVLLDLIGDAGLFDGAAAIRTRLGERDGDGFVDVRRRTAMAMTAIPAAATAARLFRVHGRGPFGERGGLTLASAPRRFKRLCQALNLAPQSIALSFEPRILVPELIAFISRLLNLAAQPLQFSLGVVDRLRRVASRHATVMADSRKKYKPKLWISVVNPLTSYPSASAIIGWATNGYRQLPTSS